MANRFEANDPHPVAPSKAPSKAPSNHFAQYDAPVASTPATSHHYNLTDIPGAWRRNGDDSAGRFVAGVLNMVMHPLDTAEAAVNIAGGAGALAGAKLAGGNLDTPEARASMLKDHPRLMKMMDAANAIGGVYKKRYGGWDAIKRTMAEDPVGFVADMSTLLSGGAGAMRGVGVKGSVVAKLDNAANVFNPLSPGGLVSYPSRSIAGAAKVAQALNKPTTARALNTAAHYTDPRVGVKAAGRAIGNAMLGSKLGYVSDAAEGQEHTLRAALVAAQKPVPHSNPPRTAGEIVPGSPPTAAEVLAPLRKANNIAALTSAAKGRLSTEFARIRDRQNAANIAQVDRLGQTPAILDKHLADTKARSDANYSISDAVKFMMPKDMEDLLDLPYNNELIAEAIDLAKQQGRTFANGTKNIPAHQIPDPYGQNLPPIDVPAQRMTLDGRDVHILKRAFDSLAFKKKNAEGWDADKLNALKATRDDFLRMVARPDANPAYDVGRTQHKADMRIANQMEFGQYVGDILKKPLRADETPQLRGDMFTAALGSEFNPVKGRSSVKNATGTNIGGEYPKDLLEPHQMKMLRDVVKNMARTDLAKSQASEAGEFGPRLGTIATDGRLPISLRHNDTWVNNLVHLLTNSDNADKLFGDEVARAAMTPKGMENLLTELITRKGEIHNNAMAAQRIGRLVGKYPSKYNALAPQQQENKNSMVQ